MLCSVHCIGFLDGTFRPCCRPGVEPDLLYSGYYKGHGIKFQSVTGPNGMILDFYGPVSGRRADTYLLRRSDFIRRMQGLQLACQLPLHVYADGIYPLCSTIMRGQRGACTAEQRQLSAEMNSLRVSVEQGYEMIIRDWKYVDYVKQKKIFLQPAAKIYYVAAILTNIKTCVMAATHDDRGNNIASRFSVTPPSLHDYLHTPNL